MKPPSCPYLGRTMPAHKNSQALPYACGLCCAHHEPVQAVPVHWALSFSSLSHHLFLASSSPPQPANPTASHYQHIIFCSHPPSLITPPHSLPWPHQSRSSSSKLHCRLSSQSITQQTQISLHLNSSSLPVPPLTSMSMNVNAMWLFIGLRKEPTSWCLWHCLSRTTMKHIKEPTGWVKRWLHQ